MTPTKQKQLTSGTYHSLLALGLELKQQLDFIKETIKQDREMLEGYKEKHGDLFYRPKNSDGTEGSPTTTVLTPLVSEFKTTIKSLIESLNIIEVRISRGEFEPPLKKKAGSKKQPPAPIGEAFDTTDYDADKLLAYSLDQGGDDSSLL